MESILLGLHIAVRMTVLLAIFFLLNCLYRSRRHLFWRTAGIGLVVLLVALVSLPAMGDAEVGRGELEAADIAISTSANQFFVDANAAKGGDGSAANPFRTIGEALEAISYGDTVLLAPGTYSQPLELISGVTLLGAGAEQTKVVGEAHFGLALRPFIQYFERPGEEIGLQSVKLRDVAMENFTLDGGDEYPSRPAEEIAAVLALTMAIDREDVAAVQAMLERNSGLATARLLSPDAPVKGTTFLHRIVQAYSTSAKDVAIARLLIEHGADVNAEGGQARGSGESALGYAGFFGSAPLVELFLAHGGDPNYVSSTGATPVDATAHEGSHVRDYPRYLACLEAMIQAGGRFDLGHLVQLRHAERLVAELDANPARVDERIALRHYRNEYGTPLHETADNCDADMAALLVDRGADLNALDNEGRTPLRRAVDRSEDYRSECRQVVELLLKRGAAPDIAAAVIAGDAESVAAILSEDPQAIHQRGPNQWTLLDLAVKYGHDEVEMLLRAAGATLSQNLEALFREVGPDHSVHKVLAQSSTQLAPGYIHLDHSPFLDIRDEITLAAWVYMLDRGGTIVGKWFQLNTTTCTICKEIAMTAQATPLNMADMSDEKLADFFFAKALMDDEPEGEPPTISKERWRLTPTELEFIRAAASPAERQRKGGRTMVDRWAGLCDVGRMAELVRREPALLQSVGPLLIRATVAMRGCAPSTKFLLDHGVPMLVSETGYNCLHEAAWTGTCIENLRHVFESGAADAAGVSILKPHTGWPDNISLLYWAAASRDGAELTKLLLQYGADPEVKFKGNGERGNTALQEAVAPGGSEWIHGKRQTARVLIEWGAHYDVLSASALDDLDRVRECAADLDLASFVGEANMTPLHWAARARSLACVEWLLKRGADVNAVTTSKRTPLHLAAERGEVDSLWLLSDYGADLNAQDTKGRTPLHRATYEGQVDSAEVLIVLGASTRIQGKSGKNPLEVARLDCKYLRS